MDRYQWCWRSEHENNVSLYHFLGFGPQVTLHEMQETCRFSQGTLPFFGKNFIRCSTFTKLPHMHGHGSSSRCSRGYFHIPNLSRSIFSGGLWLEQFLFVWTFKGGTWIHQWLITTYITIPIKIAIEFRRNHQFWDSDTPIGLVIVYANVIPKQWCCTLQVLETSCHLGCTSKNS